jgi:hypothetical protein
VAKLKVLEKSTMPKPDARAEVAKNACQPTENGGKSPSMNSMQKHFPEPRSVQKAISSVSISLILAKKLVKTRLTHPFEKA